MQLCISCKRWKKKENKEKEKKGGIFICPTMHACATTQEDGPWHIFKKAAPVATLGLKRRL